MFYKYKIIKACVKIKKEYNIPIILIPKEYGCKDFSDLIKKYSLTQVEKWIKNKLNF
jgi:hypothetical protein